MSTKNNNTASKYFSKENINDSISFVNLIALSSTEKVFLKGFSLIEKLQNFTEKTIKEGLDTSAKHQESVFDNLDKSKEKVVKVISKTTSLFQKNKGK